MTNKELLLQLKKFNELAFELNDSLIKHYGREKNRSNRLNILKSATECHSIARDLVRNNNDLIEDFKKIWPLDESLKTAKQETK